MKNIRNIQPFKTKEERLIIYKKALIEYQTRVTSGYGLCYELPSLSGLTGYVWLDTVFLFPEFKNHLDLKILYQDSERVEFKYIIVFDEEMFYNNRRQWRINTLSRIIEDLEKELNK